MQTRAERKVEPRPRIFRPAVCRVGSHPTRTGLAVAAQCLAFRSFVTPRRRLPPDELNLVTLFDAWDGCRCMSSRRGSELIKEARL